MDWEIILKLVVGTLLLLGVSAGAAYASYRCWRRLYRIARAITVRPSQVKDFQGHLVKLTGVARPGPDGPVEAPVTKQPCAYWEYKVVEEWQEGGAGGRTRTKRRTRERSRSEKPFVIEDEQGAIQVLPKAIQFDKIEQTHHDTDGSLLGPTIHTYERQVPIGQRVYAMGTAVQGGDAPPSLDQGQAAAFVSTQSFTNLRVRYTIGGVILALISLAFLAGLIGFYFAVLEEAA